jgi:hypothetical protein
VIAKKARGGVGAAPGLVLMAAVAVLAAACSHSGSAASGTSSVPAPGGSQAASGPASAASAGTSAPAASAVAVSGAVPPGASAPAQLPASGTGGTTACATWAAAHTFLYVTSAKPNADGSLTVTGNHATVVCGGPDDYHYDLAAAVVTGRVLSGAALQVLSSGAHLQPLTLPKFPAYLTSDKNTRVFMFTGALTGITTLSEQYHP